LPAILNVAGDASSRDPSWHAVVVTPSDSADLTNVATRLYVGGTGNVNVIMAGGETCLFSAVPVGTILPIRVSRVLATLTTATLVVAMWR